jgi:1,4-alpha-glucan branching enzyme
MDDPVKARKQRVRFTFRGNAASRVYVAGSFNEWSPTRHRLTYKVKDGLFSTSIMLPPGRCEYKFVVDGNWCIDPEQTEWVPNDAGSLNSVLHVV